MENFNLNDRCFALDMPGTIKFIGTTKFSDGVWAGVELDEPNGKNNGTVQDVQYFSCEPNFGLFCKLDQLAKSKKIKSRPSSVTSRPSSRQSNTSKSVADIKSYNRRSLVETRPSSRLSASLLNDDSLIAKLKSEITEKDKVISELQSQMKLLSQLEQQVDSLLEQKNSEIKLKNDLESQLSSLKATHQNEIIELQSQIKEYPNSMDVDSDIKLEYDSLQSQYADLLSQFKYLQNQQHTPLENDLSANKSLADNIQLLQDQIELLTLDKEYAEEQSDYYQQQVDQLQSSLNSLSSKYTELVNGNNDIVTLQDQLQQLKQYTQSLIKNAKSNAEEIEELKSQVVELNESKLEIQNLLRINSELKLQLNNINDQDLLIQELTESNLLHTTTIERLRNEIAELEDLKEMSDEIEHRYADALQELNLELVQVKSVQEQLVNTINNQNTIISRHEATILKLNNVINSQLNSKQQLELQNSERSDELNWLTNQSKTMLKLNVKLHKSSIMTQQQVIYNRLNESALVNYKHLVECLEYYVNPIDVKSLTVYMQNKSIISKFKIFMEYLQPNEIDELKIKEIRDLCKFNFFLFSILSKCELLDTWISNLNQSEFTKIVGLQVELMHIYDLIVEYIDLLIKNELIIHDQLSVIKRTDTHFTKLVYSLVNGSESTTNKQSMINLQSIGHLADVLNSDLEYLQTINTDEASKIQQMEGYLHEMRLVLKQHFESNKIGQLKETTSLMEDMKRIVDCFEDLIDNSTSIVEDDMVEAIKVLLQRLKEYKMDSLMDYNKQSPWVNRAATIQEENIKAIENSNKLQEMTSKMEHLTRELLIKEELIDTCKHELMIIKAASSGKTAIRQEDIELKKQIKGYKEQEVIYEDAIDALHLEISRLQLEIEKQPKASGTPQQVIPNYDLLTMYKNRHDKILASTINAIITYIDGSLPKMLMKRLKFKQDCRSAQLKEKEVVSTDTVSRQLLHFYSQAKVIPVGTNESESKQYVIMQQIEHNRMIKLLIN
eukprot:NODE_49_length_27162_cov_0.380039.p1 type:complete len:1008 gc:universal NODE_49_length_27162_cov_0.380039:20100-17077(-)